MRQLFYKKNKNKSNLMKKTKEKERVLFKKKYKI